MSEVKSNVFGKLSRGYLEMKEGKIKKASTRVLSGVPLVEDAHELSLDNLRTPFPIEWCLCVHDTPDNPCPCISIPIWINTLPQRISATGKKTKEGSNIFEFTLSREARIFVDVQVPFNLNELELMVRKLKGIKDCDGKVAMAGAPPLNWLGLAGAVGYAIGSLLDDLGGSNEGGNDNISDDLSDWAADNFPAPGWLQDIF